MTPVRHNQSGRVALCGVLGALSVVVLLAGGMLQIGTYAAPMFAAFLTIPALEEYGPRAALLQYAVVSVLAVLLVPDLELVFFYLLVMGYYPAVRRLLQRIPGKVLRGSAKLLLFNGATAAVYGFLAALLGPAVWDELLADGTALLVVFVLLGNLCFWLCDRATAQLTLVYRVAVRPKLRHILR